MKEKYILAPIYKTSARSYGKKNFSWINRTFQTPMKVWRKINVTSACPPRNRNITLDNYIDFLTKFPLEELQVKDIKRSNFTKEEQNPLQELRQDSEILIFKADKGGAVVVMDRSYYADKILEMLNDSQAYEEITTNKDKVVMKLIKELAGNHCHSLKEKEINYLSHFDFKTSGFYGLPKIHKSKIICQEA